MKKILKGEEKSAFDFSKHEWYTFKDDSDITVNFETNAKFFILLHTDKPSEPAVAKAEVLDLKQAFKLLKREFNPGNEPNKKTKYDDIVKDNKLKVETLLVHGFKLEEAKQLSR